MNYDNIFLANIIDFLDSDKLNLKYQPELLNDYSNDYFTYEDQIIANKFEAINLSCLFPLYNHLFEQNKDGYHFYRNCQLLFLFIFEDIFSHTYDTAKELITFINNMFHSNQLEFIEILNHLSNKSEKYGLQQSNVYQKRENYIITTNVQEQLELYKNEYELEPPLEFLMLLTVLKETNRFNIDLSRIPFNGENKNFKYRGSNSLIKGSVIKYIKEVLSSYPLIQEAIIDSYDSDLRNLIGHNEYVVLDNNIKSIDGNYEVTIMNFKKKLYNLQNLRLIIHFLLANIDFHENLIQFADNGVLSVMFCCDEDSEVITDITLLQLWPFYLIDSNLNWLKEIKLESYDERIKLHYSDNYFILTSVQLIKDYSFSNELTVYVNPVLPCLGGRVNIFENDFGKFQIYDEFNKEKIVPLTNIT